MLARPFERRWRRANEWWAAAAWLAAALATAAQAPPWPLQAALLAATLAMLLLRARAGWQVLAVRAALSGRGMEFRPLETLQPLIADPRQLFLGFGFEWHPEHSQRLVDLTKVDYQTLLLPRWLLACFRDPDTVQAPGELGLPYLHGVSPSEWPLYRPLVNFEGGLLLVGATQSGKGVALATLIAQALYRGDIVIFIDPKNSKRLRSMVAQVCQHYRGKDAMLTFHPAFPETGVRLDFLFNWQKPTEIASRIQAIMPADTGGAFTAFGWDAVNVVVQGLVELEKRPNLALLTKYIEGGIEPILEESLRRYYARTLGAGWRSLGDMARLLQRAARGDFKGPSAAASQELLAMVEYYERSVRQEAREKSIDAQVRTFRHNREHYQKITANLLPILSMLTSGDLGRTLSPDPFDPADQRPIMNYEKIERGGHVLYMCLDSLPDPSVARAIGALALADLAARAGMRYNLSGGPRIALFVDEVSNVINRPLIEILNKGAEAGIYSTLAMQTIKDMEDAMGSPAAARMVLGNLNNKLAFRTVEGDTQDWLAQEFGETTLHEARVAHAVGSDSHLGDFSAAANAVVSEASAPLIAPHMFGKLPNLQFWASVGGGRIIKGRFPIITQGELP